MRIGKPQVTDSVLQAICEKRMDDSFISDISTGFRSYDWNDFAVVSVASVSVVTAIASVILVIRIVRFCFIGKVTD